MTYCVLDVVDSYNVECSLFSPFETTDAFRKLKISSLPGSWYIFMFVLKFRLAFHIQNRLNCIFHVIHDSMYSMSRPCPPGLQRHTEELFSFNWTMMSFDRKKVRYQDYQDMWNFCGYILHEKLKEPKFFWLKKSNIVNYFHLFWWNFRLRVVPLSLSPSCVTRKKTARKNMAARNPGAVPLSLSPSCVTRKKTARKKMAARNPGGEELAKDVTRISNVDNTLSTLLT